MSIISLNIVSRLAVLPIYLVFVNIALSTETSNSKDVIEVRGSIVELLPAATFKIKLETGQTIIGYLSGKMRLNRIRLLPGDEVKVAITPYDLSKGRIVYRY